MHTGPMKDSEGEFDGWKKSEFPCRHCKSADEHYYRIWESSCGGYEDENHKCKKCGKEWWVDGIDS